MNTKQPTNPLNRDRILHRFKPKEPQAPSSPATPPQQLEGADCRRIMRQFERVVTDKRLPETKALRQTSHHLAIQNELLHDENKGLIEALQIKKKQNQFGEARTRGRIVEEQQHKDELKKANTKELKAANKLYNDKLAEEKREQAAQGTKERAEKKAQERRDINARKEQRRLNKEKKDHEKALQLSQRGKRKAVQSAAPKKKQK
ncbi:hypothetical protein E8E12_000097, partial [Didymella heteroderae]